MSSRPKRRDLLRVGTIPDPAPGYRPEYQDVYGQGSNGQFSYVNGLYDGVAFDEATALEQIMTLKWLANFMTGYEAWYDHRRTGLPGLQPTRDNLNGDIIPSRYLYPVSEQAVNKANYQVAVDRLGGDNYNVRGWWERD